MLEPRFLNPYEDINEKENRLPHWTQDGATYFVTFRTSDSIPQLQLRTWTIDRDTWLAAHPKPWDAKIEREFHLQFSKQIEEWLDAGEGACPFRNPAHAKLIGDALTHFEGTRSRQYAWVVLPNHVHALFSVLEGVDLDALVQSWKSFSARRMEIRKPVWQKDYFDRIIRDEAHFWNCARYIRRNPAKAKVRNGEFLLWESRWVAAGLDADV